jgi:hypothetical protein
MNTILSIIDALEPIVGPEGAFVLKVGAWFLASYYALVGIPVLCSTWVACRLTWRS